MRLKRIELNNFRPYYGSVALDFPDEREGELFLVHGLNGYGKTSLLLAMQWALYGEGGRRELYDHVNSRAREQSRLNMSVAIEFDHEGEGFRLIREALPIREPVSGPEDIGRSTLSVYRDGVPLPSGEVAQERIEAVLPRDGSQFFLFDGEKIHRYAASSLTDDTRQAIELVLGLRTVQNSRDDAARLKAELRRTRNQALKRSEEHSRVAEDLERLESQLEAARKGESESSERLQKYQEELQGHRDELDHLQEVQALAIERDRLRAEADRIQAELHRVIEGMQKEAEGLYLRVLQPKVSEAFETCQALYDQVQEQETLRRVGESVREYLEKLATQDTCVCGRAFDEHHRLAVADAAAGIPGSEIPGQLEVEGETLPEIAARLDMLTKARSVAERAAQRYEELKVRKVDLQERLGAAESALVDHESQIRAIDIESVNSLRALTDKLEDEIARTNREKGAFQEQLKMREDDIARLEKRVSKVGGASSTVMALDAQIGLLDKAERAFDELLRKSAVARREQIQERCNDVFRELTNKRFGFESMFINEDFTFGIKGHDGSTPDMDNISEGEKQVVAFSFIMGLNRYARATAPLMIDTPMARLDQTHRRNLAQAVGRLGQQTVLFVTDTDLGFGVKEIFDEFIEREFEIMHEEATLTSTIAAKER